MIVPLQTETIFR